MIFEWELNGFGLGLTIFHRMSSRPHHNNIKINVVTKSLINYVHCDKNVSNAFVKNKTATKPFSKCYTSKLDEISHTSRHQQWQLIIISSLIIAFHLRNEDLRKLFPDKRLINTHTNTTTHLPLLFVIL